MESQLFIPTKIKVGYQNRSDTYTKKLAYVIYFDNKGVLRKETSWQGWRDKNIEPNEYENKPMEGFVLNKGVGGVRQSYGWNARNEYVRVFDPRGFEFEISVSNLLFILQEATSTKGKGLEGEFLYAWHGKELVLLPVDCEEYKNSITFTDLQSGKIGVKDLIAGCSYKTKRQEDLIYLGKFNWYTFSYDRYNYNIKRIHNKKFFILIKEDNKSYEILTSLNSLASRNSDISVSNYAELMENFSKSKYATKPIGFEVQPKNLQDIIAEHELKPMSYGSDYLSGYYFLRDGDSILRYTISRHANYDTSLHKHSFVGYTLVKNERISFDSDKLLIIESIRDYNYSRYNSHSNDYTHKTKEGLLAMGFLELYIIFENGTKIKYENY